MPNPSFEDTLLCPQFTDEVYASEFWSSYGNSPDYFNSCNTTGLNVPNASFGFQNAVDGSAFIGFIPYNLINDTSYREYVGTQLIEPLEVGQEYYVSFHTVCSNLETYRFAINKIGVLFSTIQFSSSESVGLRNYSQVFSQDVINDTTNWTLVSGTFVADSAYQYLVVGNFFSNSNTDTLDVGQFNARAYYYLDQVCVRRIDGDCLMTTSSQSTNSYENHIRIYPNPTNDFVTVDSPDGLIQGVDLMDIYGQLKFRLNPSEVIDLRSIESGIYYLVIKTDSNTVTKPLIKNP